MRPCSIILVSAMAILVVVVTLCRPAALEECHPKQRNPVSEDPLCVVERGVRSDPAPKVEEPGKAELPNGSAGWDLEAVRAARREERGARAREAEFWNELRILMSAKASTEGAAYREAVMARTADFLGLEPESRMLFERTALSAVEEIRGAWQLRDANILDRPPDPDVQKRYEETKEQALRRISASLANTALHGRFKARLEEWIDAVR